MAPVATPAILVNYKTYPQATSKRALALTRAIERASKGADAYVAVCPTAVDLSAVAAATALDAYAQHVDGIPLGKGTGRVAPELIAEAGAKGSLLNHAEHQLERAAIGMGIERLRELGLASVVCANDVPTARTLAALGPDVIAIEPPELIGGDVSVTTADPAIVSQAVETVHNVDKRIQVLCGAGVKTGKDLAKAIALGADGVLLASGVAAAHDPEAAMRELLGGL